MPAGRRWFVHVKMEGNVRATARSASTPWFAHHLRGPTG